MMTLTTSPEETLASASESKTYTLVFDPSNRNWERKSEYNLLFLKHQENWMNDLLNARGHVFLNDIHDALGFPRTPAGQVVGWIRDGGRGHISFSLPLASTDNHIIPVESITLEFNPDGVIFNLI